MYIFLKNLINIIIHLLILNNNNNNIENFKGYVLGKPYPHIYGYVSYIPTHNIWYQILNIFKTEMKIFE